MYGWGAENQNKYWISLAWESWSSFSPGKALSPETGRFCERGRETGPRNRAWGLLGKKVFMPQPCLQGGNVTKIFCRDSPKGKKTTKT